MANRNEGRNRRDTNLTIAALLIVAGVVALVAQLVRIPLGRYMWPFSVVTPGIILVVLGLGLRAQASEGLTVLGSMVTGVGLVLFLQNLTGLWASWAYAWALVAPGAVGLGLVIYGTVRDNPAKLHEGWRAMRAGLWMFVVGFVFFELVLGISGFGLGNQYWPIAIIILGVLLLVRNVIWHRDEKQDSVSEE
jgi:FtsH-binding integral membrane protein